MKKFFFVFLFAFCLLASMSFVSAYTTNTSQLTISVMQVGGGRITNISDLVAYVDSSPQGAISNNSKFKVYVSFITGRRQVIVPTPIPPSPGGGGGGGGMFEKNVTDCYGGESLFIAGFDYCNYCSNGVYYLSSNFTYICNACQAGLHYSDAYGGCIEDLPSEQIILTKVWYVNKSTDIGLRNVSEYFSVFIKSGNSVLFGFNASDCSKIGNRSYVYSFLVNLSEGVYSVLLVDDAHIEVKNIDVIIESPLISFTDCSKNSLIVDATNLCDYCPSGTISYNRVSKEHSCYTCPSGFVFDQEVKDCVLASTAFGISSGVNNWLDNLADKLGMGNRIVGFVIMALIIFFILFFIFRKVKEKAKNRKDTGL